MTGMATGNLPEWAAHDHPGRKQLKRLLGRHGIKRLAHFRAYPDGWDGPNSYALDQRSVTCMIRLIDRFEFFNQPSIFLTREGNAELGWEDANGLAIVVEFFPDRAEVWREAGDTETMIPLDGSE